MMTRLFMVLAFSWMLPGCGDPWIVARVGSCSPTDPPPVVANCGVTLRHKDLSERTLRCTPPVAGATSMSCQCEDRGVVGKSVTIAYPIPQGMDAAGQAAKLACGW